ncbi:hypothetical protein HZS80_01375 [Halomonas glaciei]|uniref:Uncharacterized protein n=1 Tax=Vreelandella glaciei TaxID=186761 RepID=A0A7Z0LPT1_9GAMM|nr:hypothetical protein [Halomonas glaciei]
MGANAVVLGNIEIGEGSRIGAGAIVTKSVTAGATGGTACDCALIHIAKRLHPALQVA